MTTALFSPAMLVDPYPAYAELRRTDPIHWHEPFGAWVLTRYDDVVAGWVSAPGAPNCSDVTPLIGPGLMRVGGCGHAAAPC